MASNSLFGLSESYTDPEPRLVSDPGNVMHVLARACR